MDKYNAQHDEVFNEDHNKWLQDNQVIINENNSRKNAYKAAVQQWNDDKAAFEDNQIKHNNSVDDLKDAFYRSDVNAIEECIGILLDDTNIPIEFDTAYDVHYVTDNRTVIVDALFPTIENMSVCSFLIWYFSNPRCKRIDPLFVFGTKIVEFIKCFAD